MPGTELPMRPDQAAPDPVEVCHAAGWTDGLPVVPPTRERIRWMLTATRRDPSEVICSVPPVWGQATVERIAANCVMAGCLPEYLPVVIAALQAMMDERFNLHGVQCTTHVASPLLIINGPVRQQLSVNSGHNCFGQGARANATIGRAVRLIMQNLGGAKPGELDKATFGHPGKYSYCTGENEEASPLTPLHIEKGYKPGESTVTVFAAEAPHNVNNHASNDPWGLLDTVADSMATLGTNNSYMCSEYFVVLGPEHANVIAAAGWRKEHIKAYLHEKARRSVRELSIGGLYGADVDRNIWVRWIKRDDPDAMVPVARVPEDIQVIVAGGAGRHSLIIPGWGTRSVTRKIEEV